MYALLDQDEEVDAGSFPAYLRAQSDTDLLDILQHLDPERYPARVDAVRRETLRRQVLPLTVYSDEERFVRGLALVALALAAATVALTLMLAPADLAGPVWPTDDMLTNGTLVSTVMRLVLLGIFRSLLVGSVQTLFAPLLLLFLAGWLLTRARRRNVRTDVKRLVLAACLGLLAAFLLSAAPFSTVPGLWDSSTDGTGYGPRLLTVLLGGR